MINRAENSDESLHCGVMLSVQYLYIVHCMVCTLCAQY